MTVATSSSTPTGTYAVTITGSGGGITHTTTVTFTVNPAASPDFTLSIAPGSQTVTQGQSTSYTVTVNPLAGFTGSVALSVSGLPAGSTATFTPSTTNSNSTLTVQTAATDPAGSYTLTITGTSGALTHTVNAALIVNAVAPPDFSLSVSPPSQSVHQGNTATYIVTVTPSAGFTGSVGMSVIGLPPGATASFSPPSTASTSTLTIQTVNGVHGTFALTIIGTSGALSHSAGATLQIKH
jgi:uncharacterized membrane protein